MSWNSRSRFGIVPDSGRAARLLVSCGSLLLPTGGIPEAFRADAALLADVSRELAAIRIGSPALPVVLAENHTTATLVARAAEISDEFTHFRNEVLSRGTVHLDDGLGMLGSLGRAAAVVALEDGHVLTRIEKDLVIPLLRLGNGTLHRLDIWVLNSLAGGVGSMAGPLFAAVVAARVREISNAIVDVLAFQVGALTFLGLGDRVFHNAAASLVEQVAAFADCAKEPRESRQIVLAELPTVDVQGTEIGSDRSLRSCLAVSLASAYAAEEVQKHIRTGRTNRALGSSLAGVTVLRASWFGSLPPEEVVASVARNYLGQLDFETVGTDDIRPVIEFVDVRTSADPKDSAELAALALRSVGKRKPEAFDSFVFEEAKYESRVHHGGIAAEIASASEYRAVFSTGLPFAVRRLEAMSITVREALARERMTESRESTRTRARKAELRGAVAQLFGEEPISARLRKFVVGSRRVVQDFIAALNAWREADTRHAIAASRRAALEAASQSINAHVDKTHALVARLRVNLEALANGTGNAIFTCPPLNEISSTLARTVASQDVGLLRSQLARYASGVTAQGLADIVGATSPQPVDIIASLASRPRFQAPYWGGSHPSHPPFLSAIVLPPVHPSFLHSLREAAQQAGIRCTLVTGETVSGGAAVVGIEAFEVQSIEELFPAPYRYALREVAGPQKGLYPTSARATALVAELLKERVVCAQSA